MAPQGFTDIVFKLAVINHLMYVNKSLKPFTLAVVEEKVGKKLYDGANWVMPEDDFYGMMPEVREYFERYEIPKDLLAAVTSLRWEGGESIQAKVAPYWDGEDDLFDFTAASANDLSLLPNLREVVALYDTKDDSVVKAFAEKQVKLSHPYA